MLAIRSSVYNGTATVGSTGICQLWLSVSPAL